MGTLGMIARGPVGWAMLAGSVAFAADEGGEAMDKAAKALKWGTAAGAVFYLIQRSGK